MKLDLVGQRFGLLTVLERTAAGWECQCDCGGSSVVPTGRLRSGNTKSCGCRKRAVLGESTVTHGHAGTGAHVSWKAMLNRCRNPKTPRYKDYGGRGIKVCERWLTFENFLADMGERPAGLSLEREKNDGDYEPGNCKWATRMGQGLNTRTTRRITYQGQTKSMSEWAQLAGHHPAWLHKRLKRMSMEEAMKNTDVVAPAEAGETLAIDPDA